ncbi:MAG: Arc family DNA-binding protein [Roseiarcus sp.]|uniref:Arc family DNA-binding protein n=1 Tax=Roseiarcus sp. TaxID=1969460 RepID=UPI003C62FBBA
MARTRNPLDIVALQVRLTEAMRRQLVAEAKANERSLNSEIVYRLGQSLGPAGLKMVKAHETEEQNNRRVLEEIVREIIADIDAGRLT